MMTGDTRVHLERQPMATHNQENLAWWHIVGLRGTRYGMQLQLHGIPHVIDRDIRNTWDSFISSDIIDTLPIAMKTVHFVSHWDRHRSQGDTLSFVGHESTIMPAANNTDDRTICGRSQMNGAGIIGHN